MRNLRPHSSRRLSLAALVLAAILAIPTTSMGAQESRLRCTREGTAGNNDMIGTKRADVLCALNGEDYVNGKAAGDELRAGGDSDTVVGGSGRDNLKGGPGNDDIFGTDDIAGEHIRGGPGKDNCYGEPNDIFTGCEHIVTV